MATVNTIIEQPNRSFISRGAFRATAVGGVVTLFGIAIPVNTYTMLRWHEEFAFNNPKVLDFANVLFPYGTYVVLAVVLAALALITRLSASRLKTMLSAGVLSTSLLAGLWTLLVVSTPIINWLRLL